MKTTPAKKTAKKKTVAKKTVTKKTVAKKAAPKKVPADVTVKALLAALAGWQGELAKKIDAIVARAVPKVQTMVRWNTPFYGIEGQGSFLGLHVMKDHVKVAFFRGTSLEPMPPGESKQKGMRFLDIREGELDEKQLASWVKQAAKLPGWKL